MNTSFPAIIRPEPSDITPIATTALQVSGGMAGALIVRGNRRPDATSHGDLDTLLAGLPERLIVFQQI